jgi:hypothetical protein
MILVIGNYSKPARLVVWRKEVHEVSATQQVVAHVGGMMRAVIRHRPINWMFHWRGICRAIRHALASLERGREKSGARSMAFNTSMPQGFSRDEKDWHYGCAAHFLVRPGFECCQKG